MVSSVVLPVLLVFVTVILLALSQQTLVPRAPFPATLRASHLRAASGGRNLLNLAHHHASGLGQMNGPRSRREARGRGRDPLRYHRAIVGRDARTPWYIRVRALIVLVLIVVCMGMAIAGVFLLVIASGRFLLEILAG